MRHLLLSLVTLTLLAACGVDSGHFKISGRFLNMNQGEFYVYSPEGGVDGIDTIHVVGGRFTYERPCDRAVTLMLVFPNFSQQPIFAQPGKSVDIKTDATNMKEMEVSGTKANELMTKFRLQTAHVAPPDVVKKAEQFINDNLSSPVSLYLLRTFFIQTDKPDYEKAEKLAAKMLKEQPKNGALIIVRKQLQQLRNGVAGAPAPRFSGPGLKGGEVSDADLGGDLAVLSTWSSWNYVSQDIQRQLKRKLRTSNGRLRLVSICIDADKKACERIVERDTLSWPCIFDGKLFDSPAMQQTGLTDVPDNILYRNRKVVARGLNAKQLTEKIDELLHE
ncbi:MAG: DUF4369 domain-containing protein [Prevotella sp.]|jgi:hypothetical protein|nr:DUF4369 domain-containing protein [Prevotella sp.]